MTVVKYALTVDQSVLFAGLSFVGNEKKYFKKALGINYQLSECLIRDGDMYWNFDNDVEYKNKLFSGKTFNEGVGHFVNKLERVVDILDKTAIDIAKKERWEVGGKSNLFKVFREYADAYMLNMPFLYTFLEYRKNLTGTVEVRF